MDKPPKKTPELHKIGDEPPPLIWRIPPIRVRPQTPPLQPPPLRQSESAPSTSTAPPPRPRPKKKECILLDMFMDSEKKDPLVQEYMDLIREDCDGSNCKCEMYPGTKKR